MYLNFKRDTCLQLSKQALFQKMCGQTLINHVTQMLATAEIEATLL